MSEGNHLAIVICTYNRSASLLQTLQSIYGCNYRGAAKIDILVIPNNCSDDTIQRLTDFRNGQPRENLELRWIEEPRAGKSYALNTAIANTSHDALCFIDDDQTVEADFIGSLLDGIATFPKSEIYCGRIWPAWDGTEPDWVHTQGQYAIPIRPFPEFNLGPESFVIKPADRYPSGGNIVVRRAVFESIGNFAVALGPTGHNLAGGEDHDFLKRATSKGFTIRYLPNVSQLHAIDDERMSTPYTVKKSFLRSRSSLQIRGDKAGPRIYMFRKILEHAAYTMFTFDSRRRFFYLVRLAASLGELAAATNNGGPRGGRKTIKLPADRETAIIAVVALITLASGAFAWVISGEDRWNGVLPALAVATIGTMALLAKSMSDFSQTGPQIRQEVLSNYRRYTLFALARLSAWAFGIMLFTGGAGVLTYFMLNTLLNAQWSSSLASVAAILGILSAAALQFVEKLRSNPGLLVASMHYRLSRAYTLWRWMTPTALLGLRWILGVGCGALLTSTAWILTTESRLNELYTLFGASIFFAGSIFCSAWLPEAQAPRRSHRQNVNNRPNILMIGSDTLRADRLGSAGYHRALTPNIDAAAAAGVLFTNCYVPCARTAPSLISMLTGTWPHTHGIRDNFVAHTDTRLNVDTLPTLLKETGYRTAVISDWCGADMGKYSFGFDHTDVPDDQWNIKYLIRQGPKDLRLYVSLFTHNRLGRLGLPELYFLGGVPLTEPIGKRARRLVTRLAGSAQPFFLNVFYSTTHPPFASEWPWYNRYADPDYGGESKFAMARLTDPFDIIRRQGLPKEEFDLEQIVDLYDGCVAQFDDEVGKMLAHLQTSDLAKNTIIVIYSDHGMEFFEHNTWGQGNSAVGEASPKIPLIICDPHLSPTGQIDNVVRSIDLAPTLLDLAGVTHPNRMDGVSLAACLSGLAPFPQLDAFNETGIWIADMPDQSPSHLRYPNLLELLEIPNRASGTLAIKREYGNIVIEAKDRMIRSGTWKLVYQPHNSGYVLRLYNLATDPACQCDISDENNLVQVELWRRLSAFLRASETPGNGC